MLSGKIILITNATHFVGPTAARTLKAEGATVICHDSDFDNEQLRSDFEKEQGVSDLVEASNPADVITEALGLHGRIDGIICNDAFPAIRAKIEDAKADDMRAGLEALVTWPFELIGAAAPKMKEQGAGKIVFVTSAAPIRGLANYTMYATARGATNALTKSLSLELAPNNIQVNAIAPNYIENPTYFPPELLANEEAMNKMLKNIPMNRLGKPEEVAALIAFAVSNKCNYVTGHVIPISGGWV
ncbi:MAG: SDR family oxidoreductase [Alphaproteobacteria bacterium]|nr:SDR family oxidoreductase [Alphaproteobacteria bacterium]